MNKERNIEIIFQNVLNQATWKSLKTSNYQRAIPFTPQDFSLGAILPAIIYMFRWGKKRGIGKFKKKFNNNNNPSIDVVSSILSKSNYFSNFNDKEKLSILGDLLLTFNLENKKHSEGRVEEVQRIYPTHYMSSWIDLPDKIGNLRGIPELIFTILYDQKEGTTILRDKHSKLFFKIGAEFNSTSFLSAFSKGMKLQGDENSFTSDLFDEGTDSIGIHELLAIRIAGVCESPPASEVNNNKTNNISNIKPITIKANKIFREDIYHFVKAYSKKIPSQSFIKMIESCISLNLSNIIILTIKHINFWEINGSLPNNDVKNFKPSPIFVDLSMGLDNEIRIKSEESMLSIHKMINQFGENLMILRILDVYSKREDEYRRDLRALEENPIGIDLINYLGDIYVDIDKKHKEFHRIIKRIVNEIRENLEENDETVDYLNLLTEFENDNSIKTLAKLLSKFMGTKSLYTKYIAFLNSCLLINEPNGFAKKRRVSRTDAYGKEKKIEVSSFTLSDVFLDFLVHRYLVSEKADTIIYLTLNQFIEKLKENYNIYINESPEGMNINGEILIRNKEYLEKRLRDLGLLTGVNDADEMKELKNRFQVN